MPFKHFRYHPNAEPALVALKKRGDDVFSELKQMIQTIQAEWEPEPDETPQFITSFEGYLLSFTVAGEDPSVLILADAVRWDLGT